MNRLKIAIVLPLFIALCVNTFGQNKTNTFEVVKSGQGSKSMIFISGFSCSGEVWNETKEFTKSIYTNTQELIFPVSLRAM